MDILSVLTGARALFQRNLWLCFTGNIKTIITYEKNNNIRFVIIQVCIKAAEGNYAIH